MAEPARCLRASKRSEPEVSFRLSFVWSSVGLRSAGVVHFRVSNSSLYFVTSTEETEKVEKKHRFLLAFFSPPFFSSFFFGGERQIR